MKLILVLLFVLAAPAFAVPGSFDQKSLLSAGDMSQASVLSNGVNIDGQTVFAIGAVFSGSPVGTFILQVSSDIVAQAAGSDPAANVLNWYDYTSSSQAIAASGNFLWNVQPAGYKWVRLKYTKLSGSGSLAVTFNGKG